MLPFWQQMTGAGLPVPGGLVTTDTASSEVWKPLPMEGGPVVDYPPIPHLGWVDTALCAATVGLLLCGLKALMLGTPPHAWVAFGCFTGVALSVAGLLTSRWARGVTGGLFTVFLLAALGVAAHRETGVPLGPPLAMAVLAALAVLAAAASRPRRRGPPCPGIDRARRAGYSKPS